MTKIIRFGNFAVTDQVFYISKHSYALVNLKPIFPGHVMVCPLRSVKRLRELNDDESVDFFLTVQKVSKVIENEFRAQGLNVSIQDGPLAGQSIPHVHCHIIPRVKDDLPEIDGVYRELEAEEQDLELQFQELKKVYRSNTLGQAAPDGSENRPPRSMSDMTAEAKRLRSLFYHNNKL
ncbi:HIT-like protein [Nadsonia fulvescens var. elongata DSM 6958]|uniref:Bis(5'-adenosyl)-triphosphatase n=1 Tax=Nadsonia fulvescens var. elongata DSM 6958 TaxID=857566 RepID=A0A1E3PPE5_9ASCO|nr:HIT-like protein [Nadsonia fulvescens var. elongata DSM 6958]